MFSFQVYSKKDVVRRVREGRKCSNAELSSFIKPSEASIANSVFFDSHPGGTRSTGLSAAQPWPSKPDKSSVKVDWLGVTADNSSWQVPSTAGTALQLY